MLSLTLAGLVLAASASASAPPVPLTVALADGHGSPHGLRLGVGQSKPNPDVAIALLPATVSSPVITDVSGAQVLGLNAEQLPGGQVASAVAYAGVSFTRNDLKNNAQLSRAVQNKAGDWDAIITRAGTTWLSETDPSAVPAAGLALGLLHAVTLSKAVSDNGLAITDTMWRNALADTWAHNAATVSATAVDTCDRTLLQRVATGTGPGGDCPESCTVAGTYLHHRMTAMFSSPPGPPPAVTHALTGTSVADIGPPTIAMLTGAQSTSTLLDVKNTMCERAQVRVQAYTNSAMMAAFATL